MDRLFRDRMAYVESPNPDDCFICKSVSASDDESGLIISRGRLCVAVLNKFPYNTGHLMVAPLRHAAEPGDLDDAEALELWTMVLKALEAVRRTMSPEGFNIGANLGEVAGAGLPGHFHMHVVPRWKGDTNFMPVTADSKVLPETLQRTCERLRSSFLL